MEQMTDVRVLSASSLMKDTVYNMQDETIGKIEDFMIDLERGCISYAVLSFGGVMGIGDKLFAVPWDALGVDTERRGFRMDVSKERLDNAPGFDKDNWPETPDTSWLGGVYDHYGSERYWEQRR
jgi:sporulation protein YlmC with PRC-barrel domain